MPTPPRVPTTTSASFHEVQFPADISTGATGGPEFKTTILALGSGEEKRNIEWSRTRAQYNVATGLRRRADFDVFIQFFYARMGRAYGFRFKDWSDYQIKDVGFTLGDASPFDLSVSQDFTSFQLFSEYISGPWAFYRPILKPVLHPVEGTSLLTVDNGDIAGPTTPNLVLGSFAGNVYNPASPGPGQWTFDATTGIITLGDPLQVADPGAMPDPIPAAIVNIAYLEFDVPVRFDVDKLDLDMAAYEAGQWSQINIVELKNGK